jgi:Amt family ammonium transporter
LAGNPVLETGGLLFSGNWAGLGVQALGILSVGAWTFAAMAVLFGVVKLLGSLRVSAKEEMQGLDINEHGADAYYGFQHFSNM